MTNTTFVSSMEGKFEASKDRLALEIKRLEIGGKTTHHAVRNGVQVMPKEFIEDPGIHIPQNKRNNNVAAGNDHRFEKLENDVDKILPDVVVHDVVHEYYSPTTRVIFILGKKINYTYETNNLNIV